PMAGLSFTHPKTHTPKTTHPAYPYQLSGLKNYLNKSRMQAVGDGGGGYNSAHISGELNIIPTSPTAI
ncbi:MAG: hypothetical protein ABIL17_08610, partial [candidate division WOR-3 bacterium]